MSNLLALSIAVTLAMFSVAMLISLVRLFHGPTAQDRVLALDFVYVVGMLVMLVLGIRHRSDMYFEAALLIALFSFVSSSAMAKFILRGEVIE